MALNDTALFLLALCRGETSVREIAEELHRDHGATIGEARRDAAITLREFHRLGLVTV